MFKIWYDWIYRRNIIKPILIMSGTYEVTTNDCVVNEMLGNGAKALPEMVLMKQALGYIEFAEQFGAKLLPVKVRRRRMPKEVIQFYLKFENNEQRNKFEDFINQL